MTLEKFFYYINEHVHEKYGEKFPHVHTSKSDLGGNDSLFALICLDPKDTWPNKILENSRYVRFCLCAKKKGIEIEAFSISFPHKIRRRTVKWSSENDTIDPIGTLKRTKINFNKILDELAAMV